jgi:putative DNA primase/helicase
VAYKSSGAALKIAEALGGPLIPDAKGNYVCHCPAHPDEHPSLAVRDGEGRGTILVYCRAGCQQSAVLAALKRLGLLSGRPAPTGQTAAQASPVQRQRPTPDPFKMWREASPAIADSLVRTYLNNRGLEIPADAPLRFAPSLWHWPSKSCHPAMVALIEKYDGVAITSHATYLTHDGRKADIEPIRLFPAGVSPAGGGVWFDRLGSRRELVIALKALSPRSPPRSSTTPRPRSRPYRRTGCARLSCRQ